MSETVRPPVSSMDSLRSPTFIIAVILLAIGAATVGAMLRIGNPEITAGIGNLVIGLTLGSVSGYFLGASRHSGPAQEPVSGTTTTTVTPPTTATVTVETTPVVVDAVRTIPTTTGNTP